MISRRDAIVGSIAAALLPKREVVLTDFGGKPGADALPAFKAALDELARRGGGTLIVPASRSEWIVSDTVFIRQANVTIHLGSNIKLISNTKSSVFVFEGQGRNAPLKNVSIIGIGGIRRIDGNGRMMLKYKYSTADTYYSCVLFKWCDEWKIESIYGYNGLVNCLRAFQCGSGKILNCLSSHSQYDNGQSLDLCSATRARLEIRGARSWSCAGFGVTSFASSHVDIVDAHIRGCGSDDPAAPVSGGGLSVEGDYFKSMRETKDYDVRVIRPLISDCVNVGAFITAPGVLMTDPQITGTLLPTRRSNSMGEKGANLYCLAACGLTVVRARLERAGGPGVILWGNEGYRPKLSFDGTVDGSKSYGIRVRKSDNPNITKRSAITRSGIANRYSDVSS